MFRHAILASHSFYSFYLSADVTLFPQVRIHKFLEKTKKKKVNKNTEVARGESAAAITEMKKLRKMVTSLIKKQKLPAVRQIVKEQDDFKPWALDVKAKVSMLSYNV